MAAAGFSLPDGTVIEAPAGDQDANDDGSNKSNRSPGNPGPENTNWIGLARKLLGSDPNYAQHLQMLEALDEVVGTKKGAEIYERLLESGEKLTIQINSIGDHIADTGHFRVNIDPTSLPFIDVAGSKAPVRITLARELGHELGHAVLGRHDSGKNLMYNVSHVENPIAKDLGLPRRVNIRIYSDVNRTPYE